MATSAGVFQRGMGALRAYLTQNWTLLFNSAAGVTMRLLPAIGGFVYQAIVTTNYPVQTVGFIGAITLNISSLLGMFSMLGISTYVVAKLQDNTIDRGKLIGTGLAVGTFAGAFSGLAFGLIAPLMIDALRPMLWRADYIALISGGAAIATFVLIFEEILVGLLLGGMTVARSAAFSVLRIAMLLLLLRVFGSSSPALPVIAWVGADALCALGLLLYGIARKKLPRIGRPDIALMRAGARTSLAHHALSLVLNISGWFVPAVVGMVLAPEAYAQYIVAWQNVGFAFTIPYALALVLYGAGVKDPAAANTRLKQLLLIGIAGSIATIAVFWAAMPWLMRRLGDAYVVEGTLAARLIVLALIPVMIKGMWVTIERIHGRMRQATKILAVGGIIELTAPAIGGILGGVAGACGGWLISQIVLGLFFARPLLLATRLRSGQQPVSDTGTAVAG